MKHLKILLTTSVLLWLSFISFGQSGWCKAKGELYSQISYSRFKSDQFYTTQGKLFETNEFNQSSVTAYAEYGVTDKFTTIMNLSFYQANKFTGTQTARGPGNLQLGFKYQFSKKLPISLTIAPEIPLTTKDHFVSSLKPDIFGIVNSVNLPTSDGEFNVWSILAASGSFANNKMWASAYFSHNFRTKGFSDQLKSGIEIGYKPIDKLFFKGTFSVLSNYTDDLNQEVSFIRGEGTKNSSFSIGAGYTIYKNFGVIAEYYQGINFPVKAHNTFLGPLVSLGITYGIKPKN